MTEKLIELGKKIEVHVDALLELQRVGQEMIDEIGYDEFEKIIEESEELETLNERVNGKLETLINQ